ncbi:MAG TPA: hypothetical protein DF296_14090 [Candidatus Margulisbacteria bacterium]|nr:MAG: hypothetical protein A2X43_03660 [Candidatus Margulisbacteria bacterium GWD2_39_127]OGI10983.1 MAG: hypothetical protein A2X41_01910 [Candidatus Margulisbacteria bacterium GWE2_39_32]HAR62520.1 hypothetical protein [Candidatus Margulisiibacteriota bacterium]HCT86318.1 hypothetical protein [Candidatus Margulisiibacteriota bacterium]
MKKYAVVTFVCCLVFFGVAYSASNKLPKLLIEQPPIKSLTNKGKVEIKGKAFNVTNLTVNGKITNIHTSGRFVAYVPVEAGLNKIIVSGSNEDGMHTVELLVTRLNKNEKKQSVPTENNSSVKNNKKIFYKFIYPPMENNTLKADKDAVFIKAIVKRVKKAFINGEEVPIVKGRITNKTRLLNEGENVIIVRLQNKAEVVNTKLFVEKVTKSTDGLDTDADTNRDSVVNGTSRKYEEKIKSQKVKYQKKEKELMLATVKPVASVPKESVVASVTGKEEISVPKRAIISTSVKNKLVGGLKPIVPLHQGKKRISLEPLIVKIDDIKRNAVILPRVNQVPDITIKLKDADIKDVIDILSRKSGLNIVADESLIGKVSVNLNKVPFNTALNIVLQTHGYAYERIGNIIIIASRDKLSVPTSLEPKVFRLHHSKAESIAKVIEQFLGKDEKIAVAVKENSIIAYACPNTLEKIGKTILSLDKFMPKQVFIEAKIIEVGATTMQNLGLDWNGQAKAVLESGSKSSIVGSGGSTLGNNDNQKIKVLLPDVAINYLGNDGSSKILASPKMAAVDGEQAQILVGDKYPYIETKIDSKTGDKTDTVKFVESGVKLIITPYINAENNTIKIIVKTEVSFIHSFVGPNNQVPWIRTREAETTVRIKNGQTIIIGGLLNSEDKVSRVSVPILGDIPIIGGFFSANKTEKNDNELILTITPRIVE